MDKSAKNAEDWVPSNVCYFPSTYTQAVAVTDSVNDDSTYSGSFAYDVRDTDQYSVVLMECRAGNTSVPLDYSVRVTAVNPSPEGDLSQHLSMGTVQVTYISLGFVVLYSFLIAGVAWQILTADARHVKPLHYAFLVMTIVYFAAYTANYSYLTDMNESGETSDAASVGVRVLAHLASCVFFAVTSLLSMGWQVTGQALTCSNMPPDARCTPSFKNPPRQF